MPVEISDDVVADRALLDACVRFARVSGGGFEGVRLEGLRGRDAPLVITKELLNDNDIDIVVVATAGDCDSQSCGDPPLDAGRTEPRGNQGSSSHRVGRNCHGTLGISDRPLHHQLVVRYRWIRFDSFVRHLETAASPTVGATS